MTDAAGAAAPGRDDRVERARRAIGVIARLLEDRDEIVEDALLRLEKAGVIDARTREKAWDKYARGDARTRRYMQDLVARIVGGERKSGPLDADDVKASPSSREALDTLKDVSSGKARPPPTPPAGSEGRRGDDDNMLLRLLAWFPVQVLKLQRTLILTGLVLIALVAVAAIFPDHAQLVLFYSFLVLLGIIGLFLIKWAFQMDRALKRQGVDVKGLSRLEPAERRILLVRRFLRHTFSGDRVAGFMERRMRDGRARRRARKERVATAEKGT